MVMTLEARPSVIREKTDFLKGLFTHNPEAAQLYIPPARAELSSGLAVHVVQPDGYDISTDMPIALGGGESAPTPESLLAAAAASCLATVIAMRAAACGTNLVTLDVTASAVSDARGLLGVSKVSAAWERLELVVRITATNAAGAELEEIVSWARDHSPVLATIGAAAVVEIKS